MSLLRFQDVLEGSFGTYLVLSVQIGGDVAMHSELVARAFEAQFKYLAIASRSKAPNESVQMCLLRPINQCICAIQEFREHHRTSKYFNHLSAVSESISALGWVTVNPAPSLHIKEMKDVGHFYANRVLNDWKEKDEMHVDWVKAWVQTLSDLEMFVIEHHTTGLVWSDTNVTPVGMGVPLPPPSCPILRPALLGDVGKINAWENITKSISDE